MTFESKDFQKAVKGYLSAYKKDEVAWINSTAGDVAWRAIKTTRPASVARMRSALLGKPLGLKIVMARAKRKGVKLKRSQIGAKVTAMVNARLAARNYHAVAWVPAARALGKNPAVKFFGKGFAAQGRAQKATLSHPEAVIKNTAPGADENAATGKAIERAMALVVKEKLRFIGQRMQALAKKKGLA